MSIDDARLQMLKQRNQVVKNREEKMKRLDQDQKDCIKKRIKELFSKPDYTDEKCRVSLYDEDAIDISVQHIAATRRELGLNQRAGRSKKTKEVEENDEPEPKKRGRKAAAKTDVGGGLSRQEYNRLVEILEADHEKKLAALKILFGFEE